MATGFLVKMTTIALGLYHKFADHSIDLQIVEWYFWNCPRFFIKNPSHVNKPFQSALFHHCAIQIELQPKHVTLTQRAIWKDPKYVKTKWKVDDQANGWFSDFWMRWCDQNFMQLSGWENKWWCSHACSSEWLQAHLICMQSIISSFCEEWDSRTYCSDYFIFEIFPSQSLMTENISGCLKVILFVANIPKGKGGHQRIGIL